MSDLTDPNADLDAAGLTPAERRILQQKADRSGELEAQLTAATQQLAIRDAGLNLTDVQLKALQATHDGEWTPEKLKATATELGWAQPSSGGPPAADMAALGRIGAAGSGAGPSAPPNAAGDKLADIRRQLITGGTAQMANLYPAALEAIREAGLNMGEVQFGGAERIPDWGATK